MLENLLLCINMCTAKTFQHICFIAVVLLSSVGVKHAILGQPVTGSVLPRNTRESFTQNESDLIAFLYITTSEKIRN